MNRALARRVTARHGRSGHAQVTPQTQSQHGPLKPYLVQTSQRQEAGLSRLKTVKTAQSGNFLLYLDNTSLVYDEVAWGEF